MKYLIWFSEVMGVGNIRSLKALEYFGTPQNIYKATYNERLASGIFKKQSYPVWIKSLLAKLMI